MIFIKAGKEMKFRISDSDWGGAAADLKEAALLFPSAFALSWRDIALRYRGSVLGPFWYTMSTFLQILFLSYLFPTLFNNNDAAYMQWLSIGLICWQFVSPALSGSEGIFTLARGIYTERRMPYSFFCMKYMILQILVFLHQIPVILYCVYAWDIPLDFAHAAFFVLGLAIVTAILFCVCFILGILCLRFYDIPQILNLLLYIAFMLTPIFWMPEMAASRGRFIKYNPLYYLLDVMRSPLMGRDVALFSRIVVAAIFFVSALAAFVLFARCRKRIAFY